MDVGGQIESGVGFIYAAGCWSLDLRRSSADGETKYAFMVELKGLGGLGAGK